MQECGKSFTLLINHQAYCCTYFPELLFFQAIWFISVTLQLFHRKKVPETWGFLLLCLQGETAGHCGSWACMHRGTWSPLLICHLGSPRLDNDRPQKRQLQDQKMETLAECCQHHSYRGRALGSPDSPQSPLTRPRLRQTLARSISFHFSLQLAICETSRCSRQQDTAEALCVDWREGRRKSSWAPPAKPEKVQSKLRRLRQSSHSRPSCPMRMDIFNIKKEGELKACELKNKPIY